MVLTAAMDRWKRTASPAWRSARSESALGEVLHQLGRNQEAERYLVDSYRELSAEPAADPDSKGRARTNHSLLYRPGTARQTRCAIARVKAR